MQRALPFTALPLALALTLALALPACGPDDGDVVEITEVRDLGTTGSPTRTGTSPEERFGIRQHPFLWTAPDSWIPQTESQFRIINYLAARNTECYVTVLPGGGGGIRPNLDRWRGQMGLDPMGDDALAELKLKPLLSTEAYAVSYDGSFQGMGAKEPHENYRMLGLIQQFGGLMIFVKMVGPIDEVESATDDFYAFCESIRFRRQ